jgi:hypothetical protein
MIQVRRQELVGLDVLQRSTVHFVDCLIAAKAATEDIL